MDDMTIAERELYEAIVEHAVNGEARNLMLVAVTDLGWDYGMAYRYMLRLARRQIITCRNSGRGRYNPIRMYPRSK